jgi:hypothetical protein
MRKGGGKSKGSSFERLVCKELSKWVSRGKRQDIFWRSAMSGGRSTVALKTGTKLGAQAGDVSSIDTLGHRFISEYVIECKHYKDLNWQGMFKGVGALSGFWDRLLVDAAQYEKQPFLIGRQNNWPILVCTTDEGVEALKLRPLVIATFPKVRMNVLPFEEFLAQRPKKGRTRL